MNMEVIYLFKIDILSNNLAMLLNHLAISFYKYINIKTKSVVDISFVKFKMNIYFW